jgi:Spy/CpxP family protein refolding chaperone
MNLLEGVRLKIWLAVLGIFLLGCVTGAALNNVYRIRSGAHGGFEQRDRGGYVEGLRQRLSLNDEQTTQIRAIMDETRGEYRQLRTEVRPRYDASRQRARTRIRALLTLEQQQKFDAMVSERDSHRDDEEKDRH